MPRNAGNWKMSKSLGNIRRIFLRKALNILNFIFILIKLIRRNECNCGWNTRAHVLKTTFAFRWMLMSSVKRYHKLICLTICFGNTKSLDLNMSTLNHHYPILNSSSTFAHCLVTCLVSTVDIGVMFWK